MSQLIIWGCFGGVPVIPPRRESVYHGGHTPCVEYRDDDGVSYIFDAGSAIVPCTEKIKKIGSIFFSHFHEDHTGGLWLAKFMLDPEKYGTMTFVSGMPEGYSLDHALSLKLRKPMVPQALSWKHYTKKAKPKMVTVGDGKLYAHVDPVDGSVKYRAKFINVVHGSTQSCAIRLIMPDKKVLVYATDVNAQASYYRLSRLCRKADVLIIDCQFTNEEYDALRFPQPHSCPRIVSDLARESKPKKLLLFHHGYQSSYRQIEEIRDEVRTSLLDTKIDVRTTFDGMIIQL